MKVTINREFMLEINYDEAYLLNYALRNADKSAWAESGRDSASAMERQLAALLSLASGADAESLPFR